MAVVADKPVAVAQICGGPSSVPAKLPAGSSLAQLPGRRARATQTLAAVPCMAQGCTADIVNWSFCAAVLARHHVVLALGPGVAVGAQAPSAGKPPLSLLASRPGRLVAPHRPSTWQVCVGQRHLGEVGRVDPCHSPAQGWACVHGAVGTAKRWQRAATYGSKRQVLGVCV